MGKTIEATGLINAGGRGTRLEGLFAPDPKLGIAKALLEIGSPSIKLINHHINDMAQNTLLSIVVSAGDQTPVVEHVRSEYPTVEVIETSESLGNGSDLVLAVKEEKADFKDLILVKNVDTILDIDEEALLAEHLQTGAEMSIALTRNKGIPNEDAFRVGTNGKVLECDEVADSPSVDHDRIDYSASSTGVVVFSHRFLLEYEWSKTNGGLSIYKDLAQKALFDGVLYGYDNGSGFFRDIGTVESWNMSIASPDIQNRLVYDITTKGSSV